MHSVSEEILKLEKELLKSDVRKSAERISEILSESFIEYTSSGNEYYYKVGDTFQEENDNTILNWEIVNFKTRFLAEDCILATYKVIKHDEEKKYSLRSSIWKIEGGKWKIIFHQGTICKR